jgi:RPC5 protein
MLRKPAPGEDSSFPNQGDRTTEIVDDDAEDEFSSSDAELDDDPVVKTYDVCISDQLKDHLYLVQYPIRNPEEQYYGESAPYEGRIKPRGGLLELDVPLDRNNFSLLRGEKFAGAASSDGVKQESKVLDRQRFGGRVHQTEANYFVGVVYGGIVLHGIRSYQTRCIFVPSKLPFSSGQISIIMTLFLAAINARKARRKRVPQSNRVPCRYIIHGNASTYTSSNKSKAPMIPKVRIRHTARSTRILFLCNGSIALFLSCVRQLR